MSARRCSQTYKTRVGSTPRRATSTSSQPGHLRWSWEITEPDYRRPPVTSDDHEQAKDLLAKAASVVVRTNTVGSPHRPNRALCAGAARWCSRWCRAARALGVAEVDLHAGGDGEPLVVGELESAVPGQRPASWPGRVWTWRPGHVTTCSVGRPGSRTSITNRVERSTRVAIWHRPPDQQVTFPMPGHARSSTSAGRSLMSTICPPAAAPSGSRRPRPAHHPTGPQMAVSSRLAHRGPARTASGRSSRATPTSPARGRSGPASRRSAAVTSPRQLSATPPAAPGWWPACTRFGRPPEPTPLIGSRGPVDGDHRCETPRHRRRRPAQPPPPPASTRRGHPSRDLLALLEA